MLTKKLLSIVLLLSLVVSFISIAPNINAMQIPEGAVIKTKDNPDVYIVKYKNGKQFKRLVLNPQVFESYGHLRWEDILIVDQTEMDSFTESTLVRSDGESDVYKLVANGDLGDKALVESNYTYDSDSVYTINNTDSGNYFLKKLEELAGKINELQKQIADIKTEISTPQVDFCNNIEGAQTSVPAGMYRDNGNCFTIVTPTPTPEPTPQVDFCNNIEGIQTYVPSGMNRENGNCLTISQKNAVAKAKSYLSFMPFSRNGLVAQLEYSKFSHADAVYGADNSGANWNEQAVKKAKSYLSFMSFSYDGLVDQLVYSKFTQAQAEYGADNSFIQ